MRERARGARARRRCRAWPRRSPRPARARCGRSITIAGNPVLSAPDAGRLDEALPMLDAMISVDNWLNETTRHAHVILPGLSPARAAALRRGAVGVRRAQRGPLVTGDLPRATTGPHEWEILIRLGAILAGMPAAEVDVDALDDMLFAERAARHGVDAAEVDRPDRPPRTRPHRRPHACG